MASAWHRTGSGLDRCNMVAYHDSLLLLSRLRLPLCPSMAAPYRHFSSLSLRLAASFLFWEQGFPEMRVCPTGLTCCVTSSFGLQTPLLRSTVRISSWMRLTKAIWIVRPMLWMRHSETDLLTGFGAFSHTLTSSPRRPTDSLPIFVGPPSSRPTSTTWFPNPSPGARP